ncbi:MAG: hypothetical protein KGO49_07110 [Gammaproteobacteria bacterium]|nr:hypothetical protein [Gammaproteobacteria bacterium]
MACAYTFMPMAKRYGLLNTDTRASKSHGVSLTISVFAFAEEQYIYPDELKGKLSLELGQAVLLLMPPVGQRNIDWGYLANSENISWIDNPYIERNGDDGAQQGTSRTGWLRVNVLGVNSTILKKNLFELGWTVEYENDSDGRYDVDTITLEPGTDDGENNCFGRTTTGCSFDPRPSLLKAGIHFSLVCDKKDGNSEDKILLLSAKGKKNTYADWNQGFGSGGKTALLTLNLKGSNRTMCKADTN